MAHMKSEISVRRTWIQVETKLNGTISVDASLCPAALGHVAMMNGIGLLDSLRRDERRKACERLQPFIAESLSPEWIDASIVEGFGVRLSAPGYLDCTEWEVYETIAEARTRAAEMDEDEELDEVISTRERGEE